MSERPPPPAPRVEGAAFDAAAAAFRAFFEELHGRFLEREALLSQVELALIAREHVLVTGPPGTAKSQLASAVLRRIVDPSTGQPSLFARQLSESTVQSDLLGAVDFKVLTETGRTQHLVDEGLLGASFAFLDEVFDARDMALRTILSVLHERELAHGRVTTRGRLQTALMTSNLYLSEVLARSRDVLLAFADRIAFVSFVPKGFARPDSRAAMLTRAATDRRQAPAKLLGFDALMVLQAAADEVEVPEDVLEGLARLAEQLERLLSDRAVHRPDFVPTRYFSNRTLVRAVGVLRAAVVREKVIKAPGRALVAQPEDLALLRRFFVLGGPSPAEAALLLEGAADGRERAQLEALALEHAAFDEAFAAARAAGERGAVREAESLELGQRLEQARRLVDDFDAQTARTTLEAFGQLLARGLRYARNRRAVEEAAAAVARAWGERLREGRAETLLSLAGPMEDRAEAVASLRALGELLVRQPAGVHVAALLRTRALVFVETALRSLGDRVASEELLAEPSMLPQIVERARAVHLELTTLAEEARRIEALPGASSTRAPPALEPLVAALRAALGASLRRRTLQAFHAAPRTGSDGLAPAERLHRDAALLGPAEGAIAELEGAPPTLRDDALGADAIALLVRELSDADGGPVALTEVVRPLATVFLAEGIRPAPVLEGARDAIEARLLAWLTAIPFVPAAHGPGSPQIHAASPAVRSEPDRLGENAQIYRVFAAETELGRQRDALHALDAWLRVQVGRSTFFEPGILRTVAAAERAALDARLRFLEGWADAVLAALPSPDGFEALAVASAALERLRVSNLPTLLRSELEGRILAERLASLADGGYDVAAIRQRLEALEQRVDGAAQGLLARRSELAWAAPRG